MTATPKRYDYKGGIHPSYCKTLAAESPITQLAMPELLRISMAQHLGAPAKPVVAKGDTVLKGQLIGEAAGFISANVHAPTSGTVKAITVAPTAVGGTAPAIEIVPDGNDAWVDTLTGITDWQAAEPKQLLKAVADAGVAGMGGAGFPTHVKLGPPPDKPIDTLILNGAECEPYLTADYRLMLEQAPQIAAGADIIRHILGATSIRVAIEDNKPDAIRTMNEAFGKLDGDVSVMVLETKYPQGAEKQQIFSSTGREVPSGGLPMDVGVVVENVGTVIAVAQAVLEGKPLVERLTTITGSPVAKPSNILAPIGTLYTDLLAACGELTCHATKVISGGPMMGFTLPNMDVATTKTTSGLLFLEEKAVSQYSSMPCISCGRCVDVCPMNLIPSELSQFIEAEDYDGAEQICILDCIECGCCAFACPAHRPLVQHMRRGKAETMAKRRAAAAKK
jgi:electron transport complex protein RnfC